MGEGGLGLEAVTRPCFQTSPSVGLYGDPLLAPQDLNRSSDREAPCSRLTRTAPHTPQHKEQVQARSAQAGRGPGEAPVGPTSGSNT